MSNAASFVLVSIGLLDLALVAGFDGVSPPIAGSWIAAWWSIRAISQVAVGRRRLDFVVSLVFVALALVHVVVVVE